MINNLYEHMIHIYNNSNMIKLLKKKLEKEYLPIRFKEELNWK